MNTEREISDNNDIKYFTIEFDMNGINKDTQYIEIKHCYYHILLRWFTL